MDHPTLRPPAPRVRATLVGFRLLLTIALPLVLGAGCGSGDTGGPTPPVGIDLPRVGTLGRAPRGPGTIVVDVTAEGRIRVDGKGPVSLTGLRDRLAKLTADKTWREPDYASLKILLINADASLPWSVVVWVLQTAAEPTVALPRIFFGARASTDAAYGALGLALPRDGRYLHSWHEPPPNVRLRIEPHDGPAADPTHLVTALRRAAGDASLASVRLDLGPMCREREVPAGFVIETLGVALRAGVKAIELWGVPMPAGFDLDDADALRARVAELRATMGRPRMRVGDEVLAEAPAPADLPAPRGRLAYLLGAGVERTEPSPGGATTPEPRPLEEEICEEEIEEAQEGKVYPPGDEPLPTDNDLPYEESLGADGLVDAPFEGPPASWPAVARRLDDPLLAERTPPSEDEHEGQPLQAALVWLAAHQSPNGLWEAATFGRWCDRKPLPTPPGPDGAGDPRRTVGVTGLALAAFLGTGYTNRGSHAYAKPVSRGLRALKNVQDAEGRFGSRNHEHWLRDHAAATLAMVEAFGMTSSPIFKGSARKAVAALLSAQHDDGGWGGDDPTAASDPSTTAWAMLPLIVARRIDQTALDKGRTVPFAIPPEALEQALARLHAEAPAAAFFRLTLGSSAPEDPEIQALADELAVALPVEGTASRDVDPALWQWTALSLYAIGGEAWSRWDETLREAILPLQRRDGHRCTVQGSWDALGRDVHQGGRVATTALLALCLATEGRYARAPAPR